MPDKIRMRRGNKGNLPTLDDGEFGLAEDTKELFIGTTTGNERVYAPFNKRSGFRAYQTAAQTPAAGTMTKIVFGAEQYDNLSEYNTSTGTFTAQASGGYVASVSINFSVLPDGTRVIMSLYVNGVGSRQLFDFSIGAANDAHAVGSSLISLNAGDTVEVYVYITNSRPTGTGSNETYFEMARIG